MIMDDLRAARAPKPEKKENNASRANLAGFASEGEPGSTGPCGRPRSDIQILWRLPRLFFRFAQGLPQRLSEDGTDDNVWEG